MYFKWSTTAGCWSCYWPIRTAWVTVWREKLHKQVPTLMRYRKIHTDCLYSINFSHYKSERIQLAFYQNPQLKKNSEHDCTMSGNDHEASYEVWTLCGVYSQQEQETRRCTPFNMFHWMRFTKWCLIKQCKDVVKYQETQTVFGENERNRVLNVAVHRWGDDAHRTHHLFAHPASFLCVLLWGKLQVEKQRYRVSRLRKVSNWNVNY